MISAKVKIKAKGQHAQQLMEQLPSLGIKTAQVKMPLPSKKKKEGNREDRS